MRSLLIAAAAALALGSGAQAAPSLRSSEPQASIPFVNHNGIRDWHAADSSTLYVQDSRRRWYRATLFAPCFDLPFAQAIGFETRGVDTFARFSSIRLEGERCQVSSLTPSEAPSTKAKHSPS